MSDSNRGTAASHVKIVNSSCSNDCGGRCKLRVHVRNGVIVRIETDDGEEPQLRACARGRAFRQRVYTPDRLQYPMRRMGDRGEGKFERISWDEALDTVAGELKRVRQDYGPASILLSQGGGTIGILYAFYPWQSLMAQFGGYTRWWGEISFAGALFASMATYGTMYTGNTREDLLNSRLIISWGWNAAESIYDTGTSLYIARAKEAGAKIIGVDPILTDFVATFADQWVPVRPGTDAALLIAMAYVIIKEGLQDQKFLDTYTVGFDKFKDYVMGDEDGMPKTPTWAEPITGVPAPVTVSLAREYATTKPAALIPAWGPGRTIMGEQYHRAANTLCAMTGNIGIPGGFAGGFMRAYPSRELGEKGWRGHLQRNPVEVGSPYRKNSLFRLKGAANPISARIHGAKVYDAILMGQSGGYPADIKMALLVNQNTLNQCMNVNKGVKALNSLEFIVNVENRMTPTAKFADILLPVNGAMERNDIATSWLGEPCYLFINKAIETLYDTKTDYEICCELAPRLGVENFGEGRTEDEWLRDLSRTRPQDIPDFDAFKREGVQKVRLAEPVVAFRRQIEDPKNNPFPTLSGKIEIYCEHLAEWNNPLLPPVAKYIEGPEGIGDPLRKKYPLQLISRHPKVSVHSSMRGIPWLEELEPHAAGMNPADAKPRGISNGDMIMAFNDRGKIVLPARVTERVMPGVVDIREGAWYDPDEQGIDQGGNPNVLTLDEHSPGGAYPTNGALIEVRKWEGR